MNAMLFADHATSPFTYDRSENYQDLELVQRVQAGDEAAAEELVREHSGRMLAVARRILNHDDDSADAVQDAFISAFRQLGSFEGTSRLSTWLHRITVNACLMKLRTKSRRLRTSSIDELMPRFDSSGHHAEPPSRWTTTPFDEISARETRSQVRACIDQLPDDFREVIILRDIEELDTQATAETLGISVSATKVRLHRARLALRTLLDPHFRSGGKQPR